MVIKPLLHTSWPPQKPCLGINMFLNVPNVDINGLRVKKMPPLKISNLSTSKKQALRRTLKNQ